MKTYQNPKRKKEFIEVRTKENKKEFRQYIIDSDDKKLRHYKGCEEWRKISDNDLINITTTFEGERWTECKKNIDDNKYLKNYSKDTFKTMKQLIIEIIGLVRQDKNKNKVLENAIDRNFILTSVNTLPFLTLEVYKQGYYLILEGCRSKFAVYVEDKDGEMIIKRKPIKNLDLLFTFGHETEYILEF